MVRILVVDDDPQVLQALRISLAARRYDVEGVKDGNEALRQVADWGPDLLILDLGLPDIDGVEVVHGVRGLSTIPIIVLSGRTGSADKIDALDAGADDYVTKPFGMGELLARVRAVTRRVTIQEAELIRIGEHQINLTARTISGDVRLTPIEWQILEILLRNPGRLIHRRHLLSEIWGSKRLDNTNYLRQYLAQLRRKLETDPTNPVHLITEPGMGYRFNP